MVAPEWEVLCFVKSQPKSTGHELTNDHPPYSINESHVSQSNAQGTLGKMFHLELLLISKTVSSLRRKNMGY